MPFRSDSQRRYLYSQKPEIAKEFAKKTPKGVDLPEKITHLKKSLKDKK
jgi:hypothetical protein